MNRVRLWLPILLMMFCASCSPGKAVSSLVGVSRYTNATTFQGTVSLAPVAQGVITAYSVTSQGSLDLRHPIGHGVTDTSGVFQLSIPNLPDGPVAIQVATGSYREEATLKTTTLDSRGLTVLLSDVTLGAKNIFALSPLTEIAFQRWRYLMSITPPSVLSSHPQEVTSQTIRNSNGAVAHAFGVSDIVHVVPANPFLPLPKTPGGQYARVLAAFSKAAVDKGTDSSTLAAAYAKNFSLHGALDVQTGVSVTDLTGKTLQLIPPPLSVVSTFADQMEQGITPLYPSVSWFRPTGGLLPPLFPPGVGPGGAPNSAPSVAPSVPSVPGSAGSGDFIQGPINSVIRNDLYSSRTDWIPTLSWDPATSPSNIVAYELQIGPNPGWVTDWWDQDNIVYWKTSDQTPTLAGFNHPLACQTCYITIRAISGMGTKQVIASGSWLIDTTPPVKTVTDSAVSSPSTVYTGTSLRVGVWKLAFQDQESGIVGYQFAAGTSASDTASLSWTNLNTFACDDLGNICADIPLSSPVSGQTYFPRVKAKNGAELVSDSIPLPSWTAP